MIGIPPSKEEREKQTNKQINKQQKQMGLCLNKILKSRQLMVLYCNCFTCDLSQTTSTSEFATILPCT